MDDAARSVNLSTRCEDGSLPSLLLSGVCAAAAITVLAAPPAARADPINVIDLIPVSQSGESDQNSEPSLAVNPLNPGQMVAGTFNNAVSGFDGVSQFWSSTNGGATWSDFGTLASSDKTLAWRQDGVAALAATLNFVNPGSTTVPPTGTVSTFQSGATNFDAAINTTPVQTLPDQPWIRTGPGGQTYLALNRLANFGDPQYSGMVIPLRSWCPITTASRMVRP